MRFSIVVPVYNSELFLDRCIKSILRQRYVDYELILVDDGSTDSSPDICDRYVKNIENISVYHNENMGPQYTRDYGALKAAGDYIVNIDSDDCIEEDFLLVINELIEKYNYPSMVAFGFKHIDENDRIEGNAQYQGFANGVYCGEGLGTIKSAFLYDKGKKGINLGSFIFSLWSKVVIKDLYISGIKNAPKDLKNGEDLAVTKLLLDNELCQSVVIDNYTGYLYRTNSSSIINGAYSIDKFATYETTVRKINVLFDNEQDKVCVYALHGLIGFLASMFASSKNYRQFRHEVIDTYIYKDVWSNAENAVVANSNVSDILKIKAIKYKFIFLIYIYFKYFVGK